NISRLYSRERRRSGRARRLGPSPGPHRSSNAGQVRPRVQRARGGKGTKPVTRRLRRYKLFGPKVAEFLRSRGLALNTESFEKVCTVVAMAMRDAAHRLKRNAAGDYTADPAANRFPVSAKFEPRPLVANHSPVSLDFFLEKWEEQTVV